MTVARYLSMFLELSWYVYSPLTFWMTDLTLGSIVYGLLYVLQRFQLTEWPLTRTHQALGEFAVQMFFLYRIHRCTSVTTVRS